MMKNTTYTKLAAASVAMAAAATFAVPASAQVPNQGQDGMEGRFQGRMMVGIPGNRGEGEGKGRGMMNGIRRGKGIFGTVTAVSGNAITLSANRGYATTSASISYSIDASAATVYKNGTTATVSSIAVGDNLMVQGKITGTSIAAAVIRDGAGPMMNRGKNDGEKNGRDGNEQDKPAMPLGNGQPVVAGKVATISGNTLTITNSSNATYTIDATNAKITVPGVASSTISNISVGDSVVVQGTINGNSVVASSVLDGKAASNGRENDGQPRGFFGGVRSFFGRIFGF